MANSFLRTQLHGQTPLQTAALAALRSECKHPALFDEVINEMCRDIADQSRESYSSLVSSLGPKLQLEQPTGMSITQEVERLVADIQKLVVDEEEALQKAERDLCARFLALIVLRSHEPEDFTPERVEEDIRTLKARYFMKNTEIERLECEISNQKACLIRILGDALAKKLPDGSEELTVLDAKKLWIDFAERLHFEVMHLKEERDALREENEKLIKAEREAQGVFVKLFGEAAPKRLPLSDAIETTVNALIDENESLKKDLAAATKRRTKRNDALLKERDELARQVDQLQKLLGTVKPVVPASSTSPKGWRQQVSEDLDKGIEQAVAAKKRRVRRAG